MKKHILFILFAGLCLSLHADPVPLITTDPFFVRGATTAFCKVYPDESRIADITEYGICWATETEPTVDGLKKPTTSDDLFITITDLTPETDYYLRGYAVDREDNVIYGNEIVLRTIEKGEVTYSIARDNNPDHAAIFDNLENSVKQAIEYYNNFTSIKNKHLYVQYNTGVQTADANYAGSVRFGKNQSYHKVGTVLHEMAHVMGGGQHSSWYEYMVNGKWTGEMANKNLQFMTGDPEEYVKGDRMHFWPYGINGAHEDTGEEMLYLINVLIVQGMVEDGLVPYEPPAPPVPDRIFEPVEGAKYYLKNLNVRRGHRTSYLMADAEGFIVSEKILNKDVLENDSAAWYVFPGKDSVNFMIQNVATGDYFYYNGTYDSETGHRGDHMVTLKEKTADSDALRYQFHLKDSRVEDEGDDPYYTRETYGILIDGTNGDQALFLNTDEVSGTENYDIGVTTFQWAFLTADEVKKVPDETPDTGCDELTYKNAVYVTSGKVHIVSEYPVISAVYSPEGNLILQTEEQVIDLSPGMYIIKVQDEVFKVLI